jgi:hypothetical protein
VLFNHVKKNVLPFREKRAKEQQAEINDTLSAYPRAKVNRHQINFYQNWWKLGYPLLDMIKMISTLNRYIVCSRISLRPIFEFISNGIKPNDALMVFTFNDDYSFGVIQSNYHSEWWKIKCSTLESRLRYTANTVWDTFPWPQTPTESQIKKVAETAQTLRTERTKVMQLHHMSLRDLYRLLEQPGKNPIKDLHLALDKAVLEAYGFDTKGKTVDTDFILENLLGLNHEVAAKETKGEKVQAPGLPDWIKNKDDYVSDDCVKFEWE